LLFHLAPLRFTFLAREEIHFADGKSSNILRGAFGIIFRKLACPPQCHSAATCEVRATCPYARLFEPAATQPGPSGLADWPRPFVFRATHLDAQTFRPGQNFHFDLNLFDLASENVGYLILTFARLAREGLGPGRRKVELITVTQPYEPDSPLYQNGAIQTRHPRPLALDLTPPATAVSQILIRFLTPTELKSGHQLALQPDFGILAARARDRISTLRELYGEGPLPIDFKAFGERAQQIQTTRCHLRHIEVGRRSSRTGQIHPIGGFIGEAAYEGDLTEFLPYLQAAQYTGIGRQTVWGKGQIELKVGT
jgi:hypothetical protein